MLKKNVYLLYQPGYSGSYVNWALHISDLDLKESTVQDPINTKDSGQFGGAGTSHHHTRIPTHQPYQMTANWILLNRPTDHQVYIIRDSNGTGSDNANYAISQILQHDPTGVIIAITNNNDWKIQSYGYINGILKWPTRILAASKMNNFEVPFDPFNCTTDRVARNWFVSEDFDLTSGQPLNYNYINDSNKRYLDWYQCRNSLQPHEVNNKTYLNQIDLNNRIFELNCYDICTDKFVNQFSNIMKQSGISDNFDLDYITQFHHQYCQAQKNLQWFDSIHAWLLSGQLDDYLLSHSCIEACVIKHIFQELDLDRVSAYNERWILFYHKIKDSSWPDCANERLFHLLPDAVKQEICENFLYTPLKETQLEQLVLLHDNWKSMSTQQINQIYQELIAVQI